MRIPLTQADMDRGLSPERLEELLSALNIKGFLAMFELALNSQPREGINSLDRSVKVKARHERIPA